MGQQGVNIMAFCKAFNAKTQKDKGTILPTVVTVYADRSFSFITKTPPVSYLLKDKLKIKKGVSKPGHEVAGNTSEKIVIEIANIVKNNLFLPTMGNPVNTQIESIERT